MNHLEPVDILLVEDNPRDAELTIRALQRKNLVNRLFVVEDGAEALDFLFGRNKYQGRDLNHNPKVLLLDLKLPKVSGLQVLREIKAHDATKTIPVVIVTSSAEDPDIRAAYALGANSYVTKPIDFDDFRQVMSGIGFYWLMVNRPVPP